MNGYSVMKKIVDEGAFKKVDGTIIDIYTASHALEIYDSVNAETKKRIDKMDAKTLATFTWAIIGKSYKRKKTHTPTAWHTNPNNEWY